MTGAWGSAKSGETVGEKIPQGRGANKEHWHWGARRGRVLCSARLRATAEGCYAAPGYVPLLRGKKPGCSWIAFVLVLSTSAAACVLGIADSAIAAIAALVTFVDGLDAGLFPHSAPTYCLKSSMLGLSVPANALGPTSTPITRMHRNKRGAKNHGQNSCIPAPTYTQKEDQSAYNTSVNKTFYKVLTNAPVKANRVKRDGQK